MLNFCPSTFLLKSILGILWAWVFVIDGVVVGCWSVVYYLCLLKVREHYYRYIPVRLYNLLLCRRFIYAEMMYIEDACICLLWIYRLSVLLSVQIVCRAEQQCERSCCVFRSAWFRVVRNNKRVCGVVPTRNCCFGFGLFKSGNCKTGVLRFAVVP